MKTTMNKVDKNKNISWNESLNERRISLPLDYT